MIYLVTFGIFCVFVLCMALSLIFKRGALKSESEAHAILEGINCAACANTSCGFNGKKEHNQIGLGPRGRFCVYEGNKSTDRVALSFIFGGIKRLW